MKTFTNAAAMVTTLSSPTEASSPVLDAATAFAAIAVASVAWDGVLSKAGTRALRHCLDYRRPYCQLSDAAMAGLMHRLLDLLRHRGSQHLMVDAAAALNPDQRATAYAAACEIMRSDEPLSPDERNILRHLASTLELGDSVTTPVHAVMDRLHADLGVETIDESMLTLP